MTTVLTSSTASCLTTLAEIHVSSGHVEPMPMAPPEATDVSADVSRDTPETQELDAVSYIIKEKHLV